MVLAGVDRLRLFVLVHGAARGHLVAGLGCLQEVHQLVVHVDLLQAAYGKIFSEFFTFT